MFLSDIHGEYAPFEHILNNGAGIIKSKIDYIFGNTISKKERATIATLIYYPEEKLKLIKKEEKELNEWYNLTLYRLIEVAKKVSSKYTRSKVRKAITNGFEYVIDELLNSQAGNEEDKERYYKAIINTIIRLNQSEKFIIAISNLIKRMAIDHLHIIGDIYDRGPKPDLVIEKLEKSGKLVESQGAKIIDLEDEGINTPCIIEKSNGSTTYATRDLAAILYRARTYDFDKVLYLTSYEQALHFKQVFTVAKYLDLDEKYLKGLIHVPFGMVQLPTGKMSTREGNIIKLEELLNEAIERAEKIIEEKNPELEDKKETAKKVGVGAVIFNDLSNSRVKDEIFEWDKILNFQGETGPYIQYTYVRTKSVLEKAGKLPELKDIKLDVLNDIYSQTIIKLIYNFQDILVQVTRKEEPSILSRYLIDLAKAFSSFYNENKIIVEDKDIQNARVYLTYAVNQVLKNGVELLGMQMPNKM